jgi:hypothetical protein
MASIVNTSGMASKKVRTTPITQGLPRVEEGSLRTSPKFTQAE